MSDPSLADLNSYLSAAGVDLVHSESGGVEGLDPLLRDQTVAALKQVVQEARTGMPPVREWLHAAEKLILSDDGSQEAADATDRFWAQLTRIVYGCLALVALRYVDEIPFFIDLVRYDPAGHLTEMGAGVLCRYVDPAGQLDRQELAERADEWWRANKGGGLG